jgi:hypothetical protein
MTRLAQFAALVALDHEAGTVAAGERAAAAMRADRVRIARDMVADADVRGCVAFLLDVDPDGEWSIRDASRVLRERAEDMAVQGIVDDIIDVDTLAALLSVQP